MEAINTVSTYMNMISCHLTERVLHYLKVVLIFLVGFIRDNLQMGQNFLLYLLAHTHAQIVGKKNLQREKGGQ